MTSGHDQNPHDALFKWTFSQVRHAAGELRHLLPESLVARMDLESVKVCEGSQVDPKLRERHTDLLYSVRLAGRDAFVYILFEHQSSVDPLMPYRLLRYMVRIWERFVDENDNAKRLPVIVPLVLQHNKGGWAAAKSFHGIVDLDLGELPEVARLVPEFEFVLDDLSRQSDEQLRGRAMTALARLVLWCLRDARTPEQFIERASYWVDLFPAVWRAPGGRAAQDRIVWYTLVVLGEENYDQFEEIVMQHLDEEQKKPFISKAESLRMKGREEERRELVTKQLTLRFGELPAAVRSRIEAADAEQLGTWAERFVTASTLEEVLGD